MPPIPSCFSACSGGAPPAPPPATGPSISTSIYETPVGLVSLTWSRTLLGLSLNASVHFSSDPPLRFKIQPRLFFHRKGTRRFLFDSPLRRLAIHIAWNLTGARFPSGGSPEPSSGFFVAVAVDGEIALLAGDMADEARRKMKAMRRRSPPPPPPPPPTILVSRREHAVLKGRRMGSYRSAVRIGGEDREIGIEIDGGMSIAVDGKKVLHVRRLRWKFRGSQRVEIGDCGGRVLISWDLHAWFFPVRESPSPASAAVFVFCFESKEEEEEEEEEEREWVERNGNWSESSSCGGGVERRKGRRSSLLKGSSSSSSFSSASSSAASSTVMEWGSSEEAEMRGVDGFTLVVYAWRS